MLDITQKIRSILNKKSLSENKLSKIIKHHSGSLNRIITKKRPFREDVIEKLLPILEVSREEFESWILADKYSKKILELALEAKKEHLDESKLILTIKIDELLKSKGLSRTGLSKVIHYSQGKLNEMIIGKEPMSKLVIIKISNAMAVSEEKITSWVVADKYSIEVIELAVSLT